MNEHNLIYPLLEDIAQFMGIKKDSEETKEIFIFRILYSYAGFLMLQSVADISEDSNKTSIEHIKSRTFKSVKALCSMLNPISSDYNSPFYVLQLIDDLYDTYIRSGFIYHSSRHVEFAKSKTISAYNLIFYRGQSVTTSANQWIASGSGYVGYNEAPPHNLEDLKSAFCLPKVTIIEKWQTTQLNAKWRLADFHSRVSFLKTQYPYYGGYWVKRADKTGTISLMKTESNPSDYFLYRYKKGTLEVSDLPEWEKADFGIRNLMVACLASSKTLPSIEFQDLATLAAIKLGYVLPPREMTFYKLYSWPLLFNNTNSIFRPRFMQKDVFTVFQSLMKGIGYQFKEGVLL
ncbi:MAG: hypothetical protein LKE33_01430 [Acidaminococcus sp.]|jgi:hypothetical protein|nr:hypothetical protein [Acidaminococcus sp.]MCI2099654.1 hypothetical protein [Acidaminococcus sp.]MCI2113941.1 hypothetical protein [Acidaminococcus sp.]MCI2115822.1 hypothetical protein [Acidaminococcus sp.]